MVDKRRTIELLPGHLRTETLTKVFEATVDHLFQPESVEFVTGYVGEKPAWYDPLRDFYLAEPTKPRIDYQLSPTVVSRDFQSGQITNALFYEDLIGQLRFQGALVNDHTRLFDQEYYSWSPPIDIDKFVNFTNYYWLSAGPDAIELLNTTDLENDAVGQATYGYTGSIRYSDSGVVEEVSNFMLSSGMKIVPRADRTISINDKALLVEGVGRSIRIVDVGLSINPGWDTIAWDAVSWDGDANLEDRQYVTISRYSNDGNQWSVSNRWFHISVIEASRTNVSDSYVRQARRPIIEFDGDIRIYDYGWRDRGIVDLADTTSIDFIGSIVGKPQAMVDGITLRDGMRVLTTVDQDPNVVGRIYRVSGPSVATTAISYTTTDSITTVFSTAPYTDVDSRISVYVNGEYRDPITYAWSGTSLEFYSPVPDSAQISIVVLTAIPISLILDTDGTIDSTGIPTMGDRVSVRFGENQGKNFWYGGTSWKSSGQQKFGSTEPKFVLYDVDGNAMDDPSVYPGSTFSGSKVFSYSTDVNQPIDKELGISTKLDQFGDYVFNNDLSIDIVSYTSDGKEVDYSGYLYARVGDQYFNSWFKAPSVSRQYVVNEFVATGTDDVFLIAQAPANQVPNDLPTIMIETIYPDGTQSTLVNGVDYLVSGNEVSMLTSQVAGTRVIIKSWNPLPPATMSGFYEIPKNLSANPNNQEITSLSRSQFLVHFTQIIGNQTGFEGDSIGINNYLDSAQVRGLGLSILQHRAPMLKLGLINTVRLSDLTSVTSPTDPMMAMQFAQRSYQRFYNRFLQSLFNLAKKQGYAAGSSATACDPYMVKQWVSAALKQINIGKTSASPWANSGPSGLPGTYCSVPSSDPTYVPATPTRLGITPAYHPMVYMDYSYTVPRLVIQTHDGARIVMVNDQGEQLGTFVHGETSTTNPEELTDPVAAAWLQFELDLYGNLPQPYRDPQASLAFDIREVSPGKWRTCDYTRDEFLRLQRGPFDKWVVATQVNYRANTGYDTTNQFSYNYRSVSDKQGLPVPGHWQGIYRWFYDTDRPHTHPWEMLGFTQMPPWWEIEYGSAPYTRGNTALWTDLQSGTIRQGPRQGVHSAWARSGLMDCIPVDDQGNLLPPYEAGCVVSIPDVYSSSSEWIFGDGSPIETTWMQSQEYSFVLSQTGYLMKPARFVEYNWDSLRTKQTYSDTTNPQWIYVNTNSRRGSNQFYVHRESPISLSIGTTIPDESDLSYFGSCGFQHWISEYLISQGLGVTAYFGNIIRGGNSQLAHRMAGYINSDSLRATVDSFGELGYNSQIIPSENINTYLYRSTSVGESVYAGVVVEQMRGGWRIYGYDSIGQSFTVIPGDPAGSKTNVVIGNQKVVEYNDGLKTVATVMYGTVMPTRQAVYDFLIGYGRWLKSQGWVFDQYSDDANVVLDWSQSAKEFLFWSQGSWENGTFIALSPSADGVRFFREFGNIQYVNGMVAGTYPIVDKYGSPIQPQNVVIIRNEGSITVKPTNNQGIFGLRLYRTTLEHAVFFDNITEFSDIIYQPIFDLKQTRIKIYAYKTNDWNGRVDAPGYFLTQNANTGTWSMATNLETTAEDFEKYFNIDQPKNYLEINSATGAMVQKTTEIGAVDREEISAKSKHLIGYQKRDYLQNLLLEDATQFEFYQGFIRQKGTKSTIDRLLRNTAIIPENSKFSYFEEWLIRLGRYGATVMNNMIEFRLPQSKITNDPQWIRLFSASDSDYQGDDVVDIVPGDPLIVTPPESYQDKLFSLRKSYAVDPKTDLPTAGYAMLGETTWMVTNTQSLMDLWNDQQSTLLPVNDGDTVWQFITDTGSWTVWILTKAIGQIDVTIPSQISGSPTVIATTVEHGLLDGDMVVMTGVNGVSSINGTYVISAVTPKTFQINLTTYERGTGGTIMVYRPVRFATVFDRDSGEPPAGWVEGNLAYVDEGGVVPGAWTVYKYLDGGWIQYRQQHFRVAANLITEGQLFDSKTRDQVSYMRYYDPMQGRISGRADAEISYKTDYDPAKYNNGNNTGYALSESEAWSSAQIGQVWWDLSTLRYIDYEQGDDRYRIQHWGKIAPGTSIDVYEWVRSPIPPSDWASYVAEGAPITEGGRTYIPSGSVRNPSNPSWSQVVEYGSGGTSATYYYFWVKNSAMSPPVPWRTLTTNNISNLIEDPAYDERPWYAAISQRSIIVGNIQRFLKSDQIIQQIQYSVLPNESNIYSDWELIREGDPSSPIDPLVWTKLRDSLITFDGMGNDVPSYHLNDLQRYGTTIRPRQTWFIDRVQASKVFVDTFNSLIAANVTPMVDDPAMTGWLEVFDRSEPMPEQAGNWDYLVTDLVQRDALIGAIAPGQVVMVEPVSATNNLWTMWEYQAGPEPWYLVRRQSYNTANYWDYVDWYLSGYGSTTVPDYTVETDADLDSIDDPSIGSVAKVLSNGANKWQLFAYKDGWKLVGQQDGSIKVLPGIYDWSESLGGFDSSPFDSTSFDVTAAIEFSNIIDGIKTKIYPEGMSIEINTLLFSVINYVISEQLQVDWIIKTSNIVLKGFDQPLTQAQLLAADNIDSIIGFVNEAKPYHAKVREFVSGKSYLDVSDQRILDFDNPPGYPWGDSVNDVPANGTADKIYRDTYVSWQSNYLTNPQLVRQLTTTLIFDRISTPSLRSLYGWGRIWGVYGWDAYHGQNGGAMDRIEEFYEPTPGMIPKIIEDLMSGVAYQGMRLSALGLDIQPGWGIGAWGGLLGWDPDPAVIEQYLDQIIQGGAIPHYDTAIGTGSTRTFPLLRDVVNPHNMVVWSDGSLRTYGVDWIVPTYAQSVHLVDGGAGYQVGDVLDLIAGSGLAAARIEVIAVDHGTITNIELIGRGSYTTVLRGPYTVQYPFMHPGFGSNAVIGVDWFCGSIEFASAPSSSPVPNVYILYVGTTFGQAPDNESDTVYDGNRFIQPFVDDNHPEELYPFVPKESVMMDVTSRRSGGRPVVSTRIYRTDGIRDQYDLMVSPQTENSVMAYLGEAPLVSGVDYVINQETGKLVFISTPSADQFLHLVGIGVGGASREASAAYVVDPGSGYYPGYSFSLDTGIGVASAGLSIRTVRAVEATITDTGRGYRINDLLIMDSSSVVTKPDVPTIIKVLEVGQEGQIQRIEINTPGVWYELPSGTYTWNINRDDTSGVYPAEISISWGANTADVIDSGIYARLPGSAIPELGPLPSGMTASTWNLDFRGRVYTKFFQGDGVTTTFEVDTEGSLTPDYMVAVDGIQIFGATPTYQGLVFPSPPPYGSTVMISRLSSYQYSTVTETSITVTNPAVLTYSLGQTTYNTTPNYLSTTVRVNGELIEPALMEQIRGNGYQKEWNLTIDTTGAYSILVYVDQILQTSDVTLVGSLLSFSSVIADNADVLVVVYKTSTNYILSPTQITFMSGILVGGDEILITTYSQDIDYEFHTEEFNFSEVGEYPLAKMPWDISTIRVWQAGSLLVPGRDYVVDKVIGMTGWGESWDITPWDLGLDDHYVVKVGDLMGVWSETTRVVITYMTGLPDRSAIAWRTLMYGDEVSTTAIDASRMTSILSNVYTFSSTVEIEDHTKISAPLPGQPSQVYIDDELIRFSEIQLAPTPSHPNRAFLAGLQRNAGGTSGDPRTIYNTQFYDGDGSNHYFPTEGAGQAIAVTVFSNETILVQGSMANPKDYWIETNPPSVPAGEYANVTIAPSTGYRNVKIVSLNVDSSTQNLSHVEGTGVMDAGHVVSFPSPYTWEPASNGLQYSKSNQAKFLLDHRYGE
jgi:hypothetical protein